MERQDAILCRPNIALFGFEIPSYLSGISGGLTALPVWEFLRRVGPQPGASAPQV